MMLKGLSKRLLNSSFTSLSQVCHKSVEMFVEFFFHKSVTSLLKGCCNDIERSVEMFVEVVE